MNGDGSPLGRLLGLVREGVRAAVNVKQAVDDNRCLTCDTPIPRAPPGEVQPKICDTCGKKGARVGAQFVAQLAERGLQGIFQDMITSRRPPR